MTVKKALFNIYIHTLSSSLSPYFLEKCNSNDPSKTHIISKLFPSITFLKGFRLVCDLPLGFIFPTHPTSIYHDGKRTVFAAIAIQIQSNSEEANRFALSLILASSTPHYHLFRPSLTSVLFERAWHFSSCPG